jgi:hypothetical protein
MFIKSLDMNKLFMSKNPDAKLSLGGFESYKDYIDNKMQLAKCDLPPIKWTPKSN